MLKNYEFFDVLINTTYFLSNISIKLPLHLLVLQIFFSLLKAGSFFRLSLQKHTDHLFYFGVLNLGKISFRREIWGVGRSCTILSEFGDSFPYCNLEQDQANRPTVNFSGIFYVSEELWGFVWSCSFL